VQNIKTLWHLPQWGVLAHSRFMKKIVILFSIFSILVPALSFAQGIQDFTDDDYQAALKKESRVIFYSFSTAMALSVDGLKEIRGAATDLHSQVILLADPSSTEQDIRAATGATVRYQKSGKLRDMGIQLHYPSLVIANNHRVVGNRIVGFKSRNGYVTLISDRLKLPWQETFRVSGTVSLPRPMNDFFKPLYGTDFIASGNSTPNFLLNLRTSGSFDLPNDDWGDPGPTPDSQFIALLGFDGLAWFSVSDILTTADPAQLTQLLKDPGLVTYQSMGLLASTSLYRALGAVSSSANPTRLIFRDYEKRYRPDGKPAIAPVREWQPVCVGKRISIPMMSKTGLYLSGSYEGTLRVFRIGPDAKSCEQVFDTKAVTGKADFSADDRSILYVSRTENPTTRKKVDAIFLADLTRKEKKAIYYAAEGTQLAFPGFMSSDRIVVYDKTARKLLVLDRGRLIN
jgi:hypothetical protein